MLVPVNSLVSHDEIMRCLSQITEVDNSTAPASQAATLALHGRAAHDGSLVLYWANETAGAAR